MDGTVEGIHPFAGYGRLGDPVKCILDQFKALALGDVVRHPESAVFRHRRDGGCEPDGPVADFEIIFDLCGLFCIQDLFYGTNKGFSLIRLENIPQIFPEQFLRRF